MRSAPPFASFWFDCDSTLSSVEGVDTLARDPALRQEIKELTQRAMDGDFPLADIYEQRLAKLAPGQSELEAAGRRYMESITPGAKATVHALQSLGKTVGIISGGLRQPVLMLAAHLSVPDHLVFAVPALLHGDGSYRDFDRDSELWRNGGKERVLGALPPDQRPLLFVGDGVTDLEAKNVVDLFVGFGGVTERAAVKAGADVYIAENSLLRVLDIGLTDDEKNRLRSEPRFAELLP